MAKKSNYLDNLKKELSDYNKARGRASDVSYKATYFPPNQVATGGKGREFYAGNTAKANKNEKSAFGQLAGALLQGRRYDKKGTQIKSKKSGK
jgi:hypothetical protein